jgi:fructokinase
MFKTLSFGEVLWDVFPDYKKPGGSPANVAYHLHCLGNDSKLLSRVGDDADGNDLLQFLEQKGLPTELIQVDKEQPTGRVTVSIDEHNEPSFTIHQPSSWDYITLENLSDNLLKELDAICFASLSQRSSVSANTMQDILSNVSENCLKVFDLNLRPPFFDRETILQNIRASDVIKLNEEEYKTVGQWLGNKQTADEILSLDSNKTVLLTLGAKGSAMYTSEGYYEHPAFPIAGDGDFVGVGDAFLACFTHLKLKNSEPEKLIEISNRYAAFVASEQGGMPDVPDEILSLIQ